jgi:alpha-1,3-glucosyltransferase
MGQLQQVIGRLFPFKRGLLHALWAANGWSLYAMTDKIAVIAIRVLTGHNVATQTASLTGGLVGEGSFSVLPAITPGVTAILTLVSMIPSLVLLWRRPRPATFTASIVYAAMCSFMLGWHVHEKAILLALIPASVACLDSAASARLYFFMSSVASVSIFPLLFGPVEGPVKILVSLIYATISRSLLIYASRALSEQR